MLQLNLLGSPQITLDNEMLTGKLSNKAQALLFYLAVTIQTHSRAKLAALFWADVQDQEARKNLRDVLPHLRKQLAAYVLITTQTVSLNPANAFGLDVQILNAGLAEYRRSPNELAILDAALALYTGDFLDGFYVRNAPLFEEWVGLQRESLYTQAVQGGLWLVEQYTRQGNYTAGLTANRRLLALDPVAEIAHRHQMRLLAYSGQRSAALAQYENCQRVLATELDTTPEAETTDLYQQIRAGVLVDPFAKQKTLTMDSASSTDEFNDDLNAVTDGQPLIKLHLFDAFYLTRAGQAVDDFRSDKVRALLAYLVLEGKTPILRTRLIELFWGRNEFVMGRGSLRVALTNLRQLLAPLDLIQATHQTVQLQTDHPQFWCDALTLDAFLPQGSDVPDALAREAASKFAYTEFLPGFAAIDSPGFADWRQVRQTRYAKLLGRATESWKAQAIIFPPSISPALPDPVRAHHLPRQFTPFIGRQMEITTLRNKLLEGRYPWLTLIGEGGVGKTRLALAVAAVVQNYFADGVWFVPLVGVTPGADLSDRLAAAVGATLNLTFVGAEALSTQLIAQLQNKQLFLILDNFEHLIAGAEFIIDLLREIPALQILVTSRQRLDFQAEYVFALDGLPVPNADECLLEKNQLLDYESVALFVERASRTTAAFQLTEENQAAVTRICQLVEGSPLGIELAATLVRQQSCTEIAAVLRQNYTILATTQRDVPARHRSMQAMLAYSWQLLTPAEADILARSSVFCGGFTLEAATVVSGATLALLTRLEDHSLLHQGNVGRYTMHELVQQYAAKRLHATPEQEHQTYDQHCTYYTDFLYTQRPSLLSQGQARQRVRLEIDNLRTAWQWAIDKARLDALEKSVEGLRAFYRVAGFYHEAAATFDLTVVRVRDIMATMAQPSLPLQRLLGYLLVARTFFDVRLARTELAGPALAEALHYGQTLAEPALAADALRLLGMVAKHSGDSIMACDWLEQSLRLARAHNLPDLIGGNLGDLGAISSDQGETRRSTAYYQAALPFARQTQNRLLECMLVHNLGVNYLLLGDFAQALHYGQENIQISREVDDPWLLGHAYRDTAYLLMTLGDTTYAQRYYEDALQCFRNLGSRIEEASVLYHLGALFGQMGDARTAYAYCQQALQIVEKGQSHWHRGNAFVYLGHALVGLQQFAKAQAAYQQAMAAFLPGGYASPALEARAGLAFALFQQQKISQAQAEVEQILLDIESIMLEATLEMASIFLTCYRVLAATDDPRATGILKRGYEAVQIQAATIDDEELRHSFLENVAANREIVRLVEMQELSMPVARIPRLNGARRSVELWYTADSRQ